MIIDVHQHYADPAHYEGYEDFPAVLVGELDALGWDASCLNGVGPHFHNLGNDEVAKAVERFPERIIGFGHLDVDSDRPEAVADLRAMGMRGLKVIGTLRRYDDDLYLPFYERAAKEGLPILFHTGFLGGEPEAGSIDQSSDNYRPMTLDRVARLFPELTIIMAHLGTTVWLHEAVAMLTHPNVYGDTSGGPSDLPARAFDHPAYATIDWAKTVFGSDSLPRDVHIPYENLKRLFDEIQMDENIRAGIWGDTLARLLDLS